MFEFFTGNESLMYLSSFLYYCVIVLSSIHLLKAQVKTILKSEEGNYTIFKTSLYDKNLETRNSQNVINRRLASYNTKVEYIASSGFTVETFQNLLSGTSFMFLRNNRKCENGFIIKYIIDQTGQNVISSALYFPSIGISLSEEEVEAILTEAMKHKFEYKDKPSIDKPFYFLASYSFIL